MKRYLNLIVISLLFIVIVAILSPIYGLIVHDSFTFRYIFDSNFTIGIAAIISGVLYMFFPVSMLQKSGKLWDHSTFVERNFKERKHRQRLAKDILLVGILNIVITGLVQVILSVVL